jgi:hypothetical protein
MRTTTRLIAALAVVAGTTVGVTAAHAASGSNASTPTPLETFEFHGVAVQNELGGEFSSIFYATSCTLTPTDDPHPVSCRSVGGGVGDDMTAPYDFLGTMHVTSSDGGIVFSFLENDNANPGQDVGHGTQNVGGPTRPIVARGQVVPGDQVSENSFKFTATWKVYAADAGS